LYDNERGNYLKLSGRLQLDSAWINSEQGDFNDTAWRRFGFGFKGQYGEFKVTLEADINLNNSLDDAYNRLTDANVSWALDKGTELKFLKQSIGFTLDGKTLQRNYFPPNETTSLIIYGLPQSILQVLALKVSFLILGRIRQDYFLAMTLIKYRLAMPVISRCFQRLRN